MQCANCQFHNMPGSAVCGRCGTSLRLARAAEIDVHPPRAGAGTLALRRVVPYRSIWRVARESLAAVLTGVRNGGVAAEQRLGIREQLALVGGAMRRPGVGLPDTISREGLILRAIVPGWPQWYAGQRWQGVCFFAVFAALMIVGLLDVITGGVGVALGLALAVHAASWSDIAFQAWQSDGFIIRFARATITSVLLIAIVYGPVTWLTINFASPSRIGYTVGQTFAAGDVVLLNSRSTARVGDVVVFQARYADVVQEGHRGWGYDGAIIDRVLAGPGDRVACRRGALTVNGLPAGLRWLNTNYRPPDFGERVVPPGSVFILPSNTPARFATASNGQDAMIAQQNVAGIAWMRIYPWSRAGRIR